MNTKLKKERLYLCAPSASVSTVVTIRGELSSKELSDAINLAAKQNEILNASIRMDKDGAAFYVVEQKEQFPISQTNESWQQIVEEQARIRFEIEKGELIRFFIIQRDDGLQLLIISHHLAGDGLSIAYLIEDIMNALSGKDISYKPICLMQMEQGYPAIPVLTRLMLGGLSKKWAKTGTIYSFEDSKRIFNEYWKDRSLKILSHTIEAKHVNDLKALCKKNEITMNSLLLTAFYKAAHNKASLGISMDCRQKDNRSMGNYAIGIGIPYEYNEGISFTENAVMVHKQIYSYLNNNKKKYFLMQFMNAMPETLIDATYFAMFEDCSNKTAKLASNMFGYTTDTPEGIGVSNLTRVPIPADYGAYHLSDYQCVPPLVPNQRRVTGIATIADRLSLSMCVTDSPELSKEIEFFDQVVETLEGL